MYPQIEAQQANREMSEQFGVAERLENPDKVSIYSTQADFDRRLLGLVMTIENAAVFIVSIPFFQAMEIRGGANANQRAAYLGVTSGDYTLVDSRFGDVQGVQFFLDDEKNNVWPDVPEDWE